MAMFGCRHAGGRNCMDLDGAERERIKKAKRVHSTKPSWVTAVNKRLRGLVLLEFVF